MDHNIDVVTRFYDTLAPLFDVMTDWETRLAGEGPFLRHWLGAGTGRRVLDAACGSGGHALALANGDYEVAGADISPAMVALARAKTAAVRPEVSFVVSALTALPDHFGAARFDAVLCLGNSLPHLPTQDDLIAALQAMAAVVRPGGLLITQNLNYDLRWQKQPRFFAAQGGVQDGQEVLVWRFADYDVPAARIAFNVALFRRGADGWQVEVESTPQRPLFQADLAAALAASGFETPEYYGHMALPLVPFDPTASADLVVVARRGG